MTRHDAALSRLAELPRTELAALPTPLREAPRLREALGPGSPSLLVKHDDLTGFGLGGNKVRKLEHDLAPDRLAGVTHLVTTGGAQSNHCRVTAAAAARLGLGCILVVDGDPGDPPRGNALLHRLLGAEIRIVPDREAREDAMSEAADGVSARGGRALVVPLGASTPQGALGYAGAAVELACQLEAIVGSEGSGITVYLASSSAGTFAGLIAGFTLLGAGDAHLVAVSADVPRDELMGRGTSLARGTMGLLGACPPIPPGLAETTDLQVGEGYGIPTAASREATRLFARSEGIVLDPTYTSKAAAQLVRDVRDGRFASEETVIFLHTGGHPALFA